MRIGTICYAHSRGLGHLAKAFMDHGVLTDICIVKHPGIPMNREWYPKAPVVDMRLLNVGNTTRDFARKMDAMLFFETPFDWSVIRICRQRGIRTALMTMYECSPPKWPMAPDVLICPSLLDMQYFPDNSVFLPIPVEMPWRQRTTAHTFVHNGGYLGLRGREGTTLLIDAMDHVQAPIKLLLRCQHNVSQPHLTKAFENPKIDYRPETVPYEDLFATGDVYVAPQKFNGCSLPLQEAFASGMLIITTNRFPMNSWLPNEPMIPVRGYQKVRTGGGFLEIDEAQIDPVDIAKTIDAWYGRDITQFSEAGKAWAEQNSWEVLKPKYLEVLTG